MDATNNVHGVRADIHGVHTDWKAKDVGELLEVVSVQVPELLTKLFKILYSESSAREMGKAVGGLYKELMSAGIPQDVALKMTSDYMFSVKELARIANQGAHSNGSPEGVKP